MFDFLRTRKIAKNLQSMCKQDDLLNSKLGSLDPSHELYSLQVESITIQRKKLALAYDALKLEYPDFYILAADDTDEWKTLKPYYSEGTVFHSEGPRLSTYATEHDTIILKRLSNKCRIAVITNFIGADLILERERKIIIQKLQSELGTEISDLGYLYYLDQLKRYTSRTKKSTVPYETPPAYVLPEVERIAKRNLCNIILY